MKTRKHTGSGMKVGRTIAEERERLESESERIAAREKVKKRQKVTVVIFVIFVIVIGALIAIGIRSFLTDGGEMLSTSSDDTASTFEPTVEIVDEAGTGITKRTRQYIGQLEQDFADIGYTVTRVAVPSGKRREIDVYLDGVSYYFKMNIDRGTAVSAEDADRMIRYLADIGVEPGYVDVRITGKAYYR